MRIAILDCDLDTGLDSTANAIISFLPNCDSFRVCEGKFPESLSEYDKIVVTGSNVNIYDGVDWIPKLKTLLSNHLEKKILGICFGHQILADMFGDEVLQYESAIIGFEEITKVNDHFLLSGCNLSFFQAHSWYVKETKHKVLLLSGSCIEAIAFKDNIVGIQAHPEIGLDFGRRVAEKKGKTLEAAPSTLAEDQKCFFENFLSW